MEISLSAAAKRLAGHIYDTEDASLPLTWRNAKAADDLKGAGLVVFIRKSVGGADVCLNDAGIDWVEENGTK